MSPLNFKARVGSLIHFGGGMYDIYSLRFTSSTTALRVYMASIIVCFSRGRLLDSNGPALTCANYSATAPAYIARHTIRTIHGMKKTIATRLLLKLVLFSSPSNSRQRPNVLGVFAALEQACLAWFMVLKTSAFIFSLLIQPDRSV